MVFPSYFFKTIIKISAKDKSRTLERQEKQQNENNYDVPEGQKTRGGGLSGELPNGIP